MQDLGREAAHVTWAAAGLFVLAGIALCAAGGAQYAVVPWGRSYQHGVALLLALAALFYQRRCPRKGVLLITTGLLTYMVYAVSYMLPLAVWNCLPAHPLPFSVVGSSESVLSLRSTQPAIDFALDTRFRRSPLRAGQAVVLEVKGGPLGVYVLPGSELERIVPEISTPMADIPAGAAGSGKVVKMQGAF